MKTYLRIPVLVLTAVFLFALLCGCSKTAEQAPTTEAPITVNSYMLTHVESGVISYSAQDFQASGHLQMRSDGTGSLIYAEQTEQIVFDESYLWSSDNEDEKHSYSISGKVLTLEYYSETLTFLQK